MNKLEFIENFVEIVRGRLREELPEYATEGELIEKTLVLINNYLSHISRMYTHEEDST